MTGHVEGETLRARLEREGKLPLQDAVRIASELADLLYRAHRRGEVHGDVKPENIRLENGGALLTDSGISLATPQYMAPEQLIAGKAVDYRADIYALGAVTYEMLAGEPPFTGGTAQAIASRVINEMPRSLTMMRDTIPHHVDAAVYGALQKLPRDRQSSAKEFARELNESPKPFDFVPAQRTSSGSLALGAVLTALLFGLAGYALGYRTHDLSYAPPESNLSMTIPGSTENSEPEVITNRIQFEQATENQVVDARIAAGYVAYVTDDGDLWAAPFDSGRGAITAAPVKLGSNVSITGTGAAQIAMSSGGSISYVAEEPRRLVLIDRDGKLRYATKERRNFHSPRFSPDGKLISVDFATPDGHDVWIVSLATGAMSRATFAGDGKDATWTPDGRHIIYTSSRKHGIGRTTPETNVIQPKYPAESPDGRWLAFVSNQSGVQQVYVRPSGKEGDTLQVSLTGGTEPVWSHDGREIFYRSFSDRGIDLMSAAFRTAPQMNIASRRALFPIADMAVGMRQANYDVSPDGRTFVMVRRSSTTQIVVIQSVADAVEKLRHR